MSTELPAKRDLRAEKAILVRLVLPGENEGHEPPLEELRRLTETAGAEVLDRVVQKRSSTHPATFVGKGKAGEIGETAAALGADVIIFDHDLSPAQVRNLEKITGRKVIDRSELILDIFARRARTKQARVQVELAQLEYLRPRLRRMWTHLSRIEGGIGMRGPGETQIETDRRIVRRRIQALKKNLAEIQRQHHVQVSSRTGYFTVSLVGYTNAGKSTLLRALTGADTLIEDKLFATLDTTTRAWTLPGNKRVFLSDTVGFIRGLPHHLVASFYATLEETRVADLLLHVVDASNPDAAEHIATVNRVLDEVGAGETPTITVLNKVDLVGNRMNVTAAGPRNGRSVAVSATGGEGIEELADAVVAVLDSARVTVEVRMHAGDGKLLARLSQEGEVLTKDYEGEELRVTARLPRSFASRLESSAADGAVKVLTGS